MPSPTLKANSKPGWRARLTRGIAAAIHPELYEQEQGITMTRYGVTKTVITKDGRKVFGEVTGGSGNQFVMERPTGTNKIDPDRLIGNNKGFVYASVNAKAREVMIIDWRLFETKGDDQNELNDDELLDLLDAPNDNMDGLELKYLTSALQDLTGNAYWYLEGVSGPLDKPKAIHLMPAGTVRPVIDRRSWPHQVLGYQMKLLTKEFAFKPYEIIHFRLPNVANYFEGYSPTEAGAEFIDNDHYAQEFNRKFFINGARPAGFLETEMVAETQVEMLKLGFMDTHVGIDNMNRIGVLPKGVKWAPNGASPKDMDFKNLSEDGKERTLAMYGVSRTILGTAESDTNRATAETADYVFSKRVIKPHMIKMCGTLNSYLVPRYGDNRYISFIDPVPEDKAFRNTEMQTSVGSQPVLTVNEAREEFMGLGPVDGGDTLMTPTTMAPVGEAGQGEDVSPKPDDDPNSKTVRKQITKNQKKAVNGIRVGYRLARTKLQVLAKQRQERRDSLTAKIIADLKAKLDAPSKKFASTKEQDETRWKEWSEYVEAAEKDIREQVQKINAEQKAEVLENLQAIVGKAINPADLFDVKKWISITTDVITPIVTTLYEEQAKQAATEVGTTFDFTEATREAVHESVQLMSESYQQTTLESLETHINEGLQAGEPLADITKRIEQVYEWSNDSRAKMVAKTESFRSANAALKEAWKQSGVVKTVRWYTATNPCDFCAPLEGKVIPIDDVFFKNGETVTGNNDKTMTLTYGDVGFPPLHPLCMCFIRPESISL